MNNRIKLCFLMLFLVIYTGECSGDNETLNYDNGGDNQVPPSLKVESPSYKQEIYPGTWYDSVLFDGYINPSDSFQNGYPIQMLAGDTLYVAVSSKLPINVYVTDIGTFKNYMAYGVWGYSDPITGMAYWPYDEYHSAFNVKNHEFTVQALGDYILCVVVNDASGDPTNKAHVTIIRQQQYSDEYHQQVFYDAQSEYQEQYFGSMLEYLEQTSGDVESTDKKIKFIEQTFDDEWAESFSYGD